MNIVKKIIDFSLGKVHSKSTVSFFHEKTLRLREAFCQLVYRYIWDPLFFLPGGSQGALIKDEPRKCCFPIGKLITRFSPRGLSGGSDQGRTPKMLFPYWKIDHFISASHVIFLFHPKFKQNLRK